MAEFNNLYAHGFVRVAACSPKVSLADPASNARETIELMRKADAAGASLLVCPELGLSGYTLDDLHMQSCFLQTMLRPGKTRRVNHRVADPYRVRG